MQIKNLIPALPERGKIKIGRKGPKRQSQSGTSYGLPQKLDHFVITTMARDQEDNYLPDAALMATIAQRTGQPADHITRIPVRLLYNDPELNLATRYAAFKGRALWCSGDGETAQRLNNDGTRGQVGCTCECVQQGYEGPLPRCKINGVLSLVIDGAPGVGGVWKFRTTSYNSVQGLWGSLQFVRNVTGGQLANLPLILVVGPKIATLPNGQQQTVYVVGLEFDGSLEQLRDLGYKIALENQAAHLRHEQIETEARRLLQAPPAENALFPGEDSDDIVPEFYPEGEQAAPTIQAPEDSEESNEAPSVNEIAGRGRGRTRGSKTKKTPEPAGSKPAVQAPADPQPEQEEHEQQAQAPAPPLAAPDDADLF